MWKICWRWLPHWACRWTAFPSMWALAPATPQHLLRYSSVASTSELSGGTACCSHFLLLRVSTQGLVLRSPASPLQAIAAAAHVFQAGRAHGYSMRVLDIGGGFAGCMPMTDGSVDLGRVPEAVNKALDVHFPAGSGVRIIAEPGRWDS